MLNRCPDFRVKPLDEKWDLVLTEDLYWIFLRGRHADGQVCFLAQWLANNKKQPCGFMGCSEDHSLVLHPPPQRAMVNVLWTVARGWTVATSAVIRMTPRSWGRERTVNCAVGVTWG